MCDVRALTFEIFDLEISFFSLRVYTSFSTVMNLQRRNGVAKVSAVGVSKIYDGHVG